jgi:hypothetical protein
MKRAPRLLPLAFAMALVCLPVAAQAGEKEDILAAARAAFAPYMDEAATARPTGNCRSIRRAPPR